MDKTVDGRLRRPARQDRGPSEGWNVVGARSYPVRGRHPERATWSDLIGRSERDQATLTVKMSAPITVRVHPNTYWCGLVGRLEAGRLHPIT